MRDNHVVLSDAELEKLNQARESMYGTDSVPYGEVVESLIEEAGYE